MALNPDELEAGELLAEVNIRPISAANPRGLGQGGQRNYIAVAAALALFGNAVLRESLGDRAAVATMLEQVAAAAVLIQGGPVSSVRVGDGPAQTGAVVINIDALSAELEQQMADLQAAQAAIVASVTASRAYALAFGG